MKLIISLTATFLLFIPAVAQSYEAEWMAGFTGIVDNREYFNSVQTGKTILGGRISALAGLRFDSTRGIAGGLTALQQYGSRDLIDQTRLYLYYHSTGRPLTFYFGVFPRQQLLSYPLMLLSDSLDYYRPQIEGTLLQIQGRLGVENVWVDWTGMIKGPAHESFLCGISGTTAYRFGCVRHYFLYYHYAHSELRPADEYIKDNGGGMIQAGVRFYQRGPIDSLRIFAGYAGSFSRVRDNSSPWSTGQSGIFEAFVDLPRGGLHVLYNNGTPQRLDWGDSFYRGRSYCRTDFTVLPICSENVRARFTLALHFIDRHIDHQEIFLLTAGLGGRKVLRERGRE
jgi:hypothetical protein